ncbi:MAG: hypothetical protein H0T54_08865 [Geodermatophilaceae bacterium]|nr:hypothetical protein [Geodermatophilaceae bacterium]
MPIAKVDLPSTIAAVLAFTQAAAAALGVLAVGRTPAGVLDIPAVEQVGVGILTSLLAIALAIGCALVLVGRASRVIVLAAIGSLVISAYWIFLRPPPDGFPTIAVGYAVLPVLILGLLAVSTQSAARAARRPTPAGAAEDAEPSAQLPDQDTKDAISA